MSRSVARQHVSRAQSLALAGGAMVFGFLPLLLFLSIFVLACSFLSHPLPFSLEGCQAGAENPAISRADIGVGAVLLYLLEVGGALMTLLGNLFFWKRAKIGIFVAWLFITLGLDFVVFCWLVLRLLTSLKNGSWGF